MKPCPFCTAAVPDDVTFTPGSMFCGACGRNAQQVQMAPTLPPGAVPFAQPQPQPGFGAPQPGPQVGGPQAWQAPPGNPQGWQTPPAGPQVGGPQVGGPQAWQAPPAGPQVGVPPGGYQYGNQPQNGAQGWQAPQAGPQIGNPQGWQAPPGAQNNVGAAPPGLNWGAFLLPFIWGPANNVWIGLASLIGLFGGIFSFASLGVSIYLLIKGNELAWKAKPWQSVEQFQAAQKPWIMWGLVVTVIGIVLVMLSRAALMQQAGYGGYHF